MISKPLCYKLKRAIISPAMLISVVIGTYMMFSRFFLTLYNIYKMSGTLSIKNLENPFLYHIYTSHFTGGFDIFAPILAVLPAATVFCDDYNSGYIKSILQRTDKNSYIRENILCSTIAGGLSTFIPSLITACFFVIIGKPYLTVDVRDGFGTLFEMSIFEDIQFIMGGGLVVIILLILSFLFGAVWSNVGLCISAFIPNRYVALTIPFVLYFVMFLFCYRVNDLLFLSPVNMLMPDVSVIPFFWYPFVYQCIWLLIVIIVFYKKVRRRLNDV